MPTKRERLLPCGCNAPTRVVDTNVSEGGNAVRRRIECRKCGERFTTIERIARAYRGYRGYNDDD